MRGLRRLEARRQMEESNFLSQRARTHNFNPAVDLRLLDYIVEPDPNLLCAICRCPFVDPVVLTECDHCFCRDCIRQSWSTYTPLGPRGDCPTCRTPAKLGPRSATSKILVNILDDLAVKCPQNVEGCTNQVKRGEVQDHVNLYCGYASIECTAPDCELPVRRKDVGQGCLHFGVSCLSCHANMHVANLEQHWLHSCHDRKTVCSLCKSPVLVRELDAHSRETCPAISLPCPGAEIGCGVRSKRSQADVHAKSCTFAKLAPVIQGLGRRLEEQETVQKGLGRKVKVLEEGFEGVRRVLYQSESGTGLGERVEEGVVDESRIPFLLDEEEEGPQPPSTRLAAGIPPHPDASLFPPFSSSSALDMNMDPYASPLNHLLSLHESLRAEVARTTAALQDLDARHSMQSLNENLRLRDELAYLGAQVGGLQRGVVWLTQERLQRGGGVGGGGSVGSDIAGAGAGVEAAVSAVGSAASALRGVGRIGGAMGVGMRRGVSEEGRTKL